MTDRPGGREMGGYLLLSYGTAWGIWLMCGMMPPGAVTAQLLNTVVMWTPALAVWLMWLAGRRRAARPEKELEVVSGCLGPIPGCRSPGCAALFWRISPGF